MTLGSIAAVVVTYNRCDLLDNVITFIKKQSRKVDCLIIIDNASTDETQTIVNNQIQTSGLKIDYVKLEKNIGGAGGFYNGAKKAYCNGYSAVWFMDDDTMPNVDALSQLEIDLLLFENNTGYKPAFICSTVLWKNDDICEMNIPNPAWDWTRYLCDNHNVALVNACSFVSVLVRREKIKNHGLPFPGFFIWYDDVEFTSRLCANDYPGLLSMSSKVHHHLNENIGVNYKMITKDNAWKFKYGIRNECAVILRDRGLLSFINFGSKKLRECFLSDISLKIKLDLVFSCLSAFWFKIKIEYPQ